MSLQVRDVAVRRGGIPLLEGVSFEVQTGEALILRGANGIGKTSLLRCLAGLQPAVSGDIITTETTAYASHADGVKTALSVAENLEFWADIYGQSVPDALYAQFDIAALRDRPAGKLSSGQKRRVGLARLGVIGQKILFLDEPTISLDAASVRLFADWLTEHHLAKGGSAVIATHIDLGIKAPELELHQFRARADSFDTDEAFL